MKTIILGMLFGISNVALAYHHPATGNGYSCMMSIYATVDHANCKPHIIFESKPEAIQTRVDGSRYTTVSQTLDNSECIEAMALSETSRFVGDVTKTNGLKIVAPVFSISTSPVYNNNDGVIDTEMRHGVQYYINKDVSKQAEDREVRFVDELIRNNFSEIEVIYDDANKKLNISIADKKARLYSVTANFAKGVLTNSGRLNFDFPVPGSDSAKRIFNFSFSCSAETSRN